jgi:Alpha amylase, catalytic domain
MTIEARIPAATYRLQFNSRLTFEQAAGLVDYLYDLGLSDCYASPLLTARRGSSHGYDITDHSKLNPEIGSEEEFAEFARRLGRRGMGLILDVVPNHMSIAGSSNRWWNDVLENGPSSPYAQFFDIEWMPPKPDLAGKVLLPMLALCGFKIARFDFKALRSHFFQFLRIEFLKQATVVDDADARGEAVHLRKDVAGHEHGHAFFAGETRQEFTDLDHARRVKAVGGFVKDQQLGLVQQRARQTQALEVTRRKRARFSIRVRSEPQALDDMSRGVPVRNPLQAAGDLQVFLNGQFRIGGGLLDQVANLPPRAAPVWPDSLPQRFDRPRTRADHA